MILDVLENAHRYTPLHPLFAKAFAFLARPDLRELALGKYEIDGDRVYAMVDKGTGRAREEAPLEAHEKYIDIQLVLAGTDTMGWKATSRCTRPTKEYNRAKDIRFFADAPDAWVAVHPGAFVIFFPEDAHAPLVSPGELHKVIVKVAAKP
ncbi:MAG: YhcH/YjgK/YiaL family protein [Thermodesulfobacteriota bacterium]